MPAQTVARFVSLPPQVVALEGHLREGRARLAGGYSVDWSLEGLPLLLARVQGTFRVSGDDTLLTGQAALWRGGASARDVSGRIGPGLAALLAGGPCDLRGSVDLRRFSFGGRTAEADGDMDIVGGNCVLAGRAIDLPDTRIVLTGEDDAAHATATSGSGDELASARLTPGRRLFLRIEPDGSRLAGLPSSAPIEVDMAF